MTNKTVLLARGVELMRQFCEHNGMTIPSFTVRSPQEWPFNACAYYRPTYIELCLQRCAHIGTAGACWSYPGYVIDRTPFGVIQHELGHHADCSMSGESIFRGFQGSYSIAMRALSKEPKLTNYCPNDAEWFAEMFRLFITNPDLLAYLRPRTYALIKEDFKPLERGVWQGVLRDAPQRTIDRANKLVFESIEGAAS